MRAIPCGCAIAEAIPELGLDVRVGLHTGECELMDGKVAGIAVHTGARVASNAQPGEVLVSSTVKDLETRDEYLEDIPVADTVLVLQALAARRGLAVSLTSPLLPPG